MRIYNLFGEHWDYSGHSYIGSFSSYKKANDFRRGLDIGYYTIRIWACLLDEGVSVALSEKELAFEEGWQDCHSNLDSNKCRPSNPKYLADYASGYEDRLIQKEKRYAN